MIYPHLLSIVRQICQSGIWSEIIQLAVGELIYDEAQINDEWKNLTINTFLSDTKLKIRIIPAEQQCMWCFLIYHPQKNETTCPQCKAVGAKILKGEEFYLDEE